MPTKELSLTVSDYDGSVRFFGGGGLPLDALPARHRHESKWLRAPVTRPLTEVDKDARIIAGYVVAEEGHIIGHDAEFDGKALKSIVKLMKANKDGTKVRFGHPSMSDDGLGKFLGRAKNPRLDSVTIQREGKDVEVPAVRADLHLSDTAFEDNPNGNLGQYVLDLAEEDATAFASSLVLEVEEEVRIEKDGTRKKDENDVPLPILWRPLAIHASDVVDSGAAVTSFLSTAGLPDKVLREGVELLDAQFDGKSREFVAEHLAKFAERYLSGRFGEGGEFASSPQGVANGRLTIQAVRDHANATNNAVRTDLMLNLPSGDWGRLSFSWMAQLADELDAAPRMGAINDDPEGTRYIQISDTLVGGIVKGLRVMSQPFNPVTTAQIEASRDAAEDDLIAGNVAKEIERLGDQLDNLNTCMADAVECRDEVMRRIAARCASASEGEASGPSVDILARQREIREVMRDAT